MNVRDWLKQADPVGREEPLDAGELEQMRRRIVAAADEPAPTMALGMRAAWAGAIAAIILVASAGALQFRKPVSPDAAERTHGLNQAPHEADARELSRRQLHFATPGGTRIIWTFNPEFRP